MWGNWDSLAETMAMVFVFAIIGLVAAVGVVGFLLYLAVTHLHWG